MLRESVAAAAGTLSRLICRPRGEVRGCLVMVHGIGDHSGRYESLFAYLAEAGIAIAAPDLPGHGKSFGRRGHIASLGEVDDAIDGARQRLLEIAPDAGCGIAGHSMGAMLVLDHLCRGGGESFDWAWLSSALVEPSYGKGRLLISACRALAKVAPSLTIRNGVRLRECYDADVVGITREEERASGTHNRISLGLGAELLAAGERVATAADTLLGARPVLMTHGEDDPVCPIRYARDLFARLPSKKKEFLGVANALHEPWHQPEVAKAVRDWIERRFAAG